VTRWLQKRRDRVQGELDDLNDTALAPFEHAEELATKREQLRALTAELRLEAQSEAAKAAAAKAQMWDRDREAPSLAEVQAAGLLPTWDETQAFIDELCRRNSP
jgi:septal ring factor EnvC (AmiA/AmiB activator)